MKTKFLMLLKAFVLVIIFLLLIDFMQPLFPIPTYAVLVIWSVFFFLLLWLDSVLANKPLFNSSLAPVLLFSLVFSFMLSKLQLQTAESKVYGFLSSNLCVISDFQILVGLTELQNWSEDQHQTKQASSACGSQTNQRKNKNENSNSSDQSLQASSINPHQTKIIKFRGVEKTYVYLQALVDANYRPGKIIIKTYKPVKLSYKVISLAQDKAQRQASKQAKLVMAMNKIKSAKPKPQQLRKSSSQLSNKHKGEAIKPSNTKSALASNQAQKPRPYPVLEFQQAHEKTMTKKQRKLSSLNMDLLEAVTLGDVAMIKLVLKQGADVNFRLANNEKAHLLFRAANTRNAAACVNLLVKAGADVNEASSTGRTPLFIHTQMNRIGAIRVLLQAGANPNLQAKDGSSAIYTAAREGRLYALQLLVKYGGKTTVRLNNGGSPLIAAAANGHEDVVSYLLSLGANPELRDKNGLSSYDYAIENNHERVAQILLKNKQAE